MTREGTRAPQSRLRFLIARTLRDDPALDAMSVPQPEVLSALAGKHVALVGNARALAGSAQGAAIDSADIVIRINRAPMPDARSHGSRTDWLALAVRLGKGDRERLAPSRILWMSPKRKRLDWDTARSAGFYLHPQADHAALRARLDAPPTTGALMIDLILRAPIASLTLYGFDFFASQSLSGRRSAAQVPHDFSAEGAWVQAMMAQDNRLRLVPPGGQD